MAHQWQGLIREYTDRLPLDDGDPIVTLKEGGAPPAHARAPNSRTGASVYVKVEGANPADSFKNYGVTTAISQVLTTGAKVVVCVLTGNTLVSAAAYAAVAGLSVAVILPAGKIAAGELAQAIVHGATFVVVDGNFDDCLRIVRELTENHPTALVNSVNPYRLQGQKTAMFETVDGLSDAPDIHVLPVGNAGNINAYWMGYCEYAGRTALTSMACTTGAALAPTKMSQMWGVQAWDAVSLVLGHAVKNPETVATAIRIRNPASWKYAGAARDDSRGWIDRVTDEQIPQAQSILAAGAGVFVGPGSVISVVGFLQAVEQGKVPEGVMIVCTVTDNGLKNTTTTLEGRELSSDLAAPTLGTVASALDL